jgi:2-polyprenyl-6-methoxyphenol hydroxylase-like FAD-dependent oxidoreductase
MATRVVVLGGGFAGLATVLALARDRHSVTLIERDPLEAGEPLASWRWPRSGIPHFLQPHAFVPGGRRELREGFPDVYQALLAAGARDVDLRPKIVGPVREEDQELAYFAARRPLIEWALRRAVLAEPGIRVMSGVQASGLDGIPGDPPRVSGVRVGPGAIESDLVIDAMGRRSPMDSWIRALGGREVERRATECGILYYSRYYHVRDGESLPDGPWLPGPRGDLGYAGYSSFPGDNRTFAAVLAIPPGEAELKGLRHTAAFEAAVAAIPTLRAWTDPSVSEPVTEVAAMGSLQNAIRGRAGDDPAAIGVIGVGDAVCHTDPAMALGLTLALLHARELAHTLREHREPGDAARAFDAAIRPAIEERFTYASEMNASRTRQWAGGTVDVARRDGGDYALFTMVAGSAAALADGDVLRRVVRRNTLLEPLGVLDGDPVLLDRIERLFGDLMSKPRPRPGPSREEMLGLIREATAPR